MSDDGRSASGRTSPVRPLLAATILVATALAVFGWPSQRTSVREQLSQARDQAVSAVRSAESAVDTWSRGRSTITLLSVQLADARDQSVEAYSTAASLNPPGEVDARLQNSLTTAVSAAVSTVNDVTVLVESERSTNTAPDMRQRLRAAVDDLVSAVPP